MSLFYKYPDDPLYPGNAYAGNIELRAGSLSLSNDSHITSSMWGDGDAGNISIDVRDGVSMEDSSIAALVLLGEGNAGHIELKAESLSLSDDSAIQAQSYAGGNAGYISIDVKDAISLSESRIYTAATGEGFGNAGYIELKAGSLSLKSESWYDPASIDSSSDGAGDAGYISVNVDGPVTISGYESGIFTKAEGDGNAGYIEVTAESLSIRDAGQVAASSEGKGNAGYIKIDAKDSVSISGYKVRGRGINRRVYPSGIFSAALGSGLGGDIELSTTHLSLTDGGRIDAESAGYGDGGSITIEVDTFHSDNGSVTTESEGGWGGEITITGNAVVLESESQITANARFGEEDVAGGNVFIDTGALVLLDGSSITAQAEEGGAYGGNIEINSQAVIFTGRPDEAFNASSNVEGREGKVTITAPAVDIGSGLAVLPAEFIDVEALMPKQCATRAEDMSSFIVKGRDIFAPEKDFKSFTAPELNEAVETAEKGNDHLAASYALGYLGQIYEKERQYTKALAYTRRAVFEAQQANAPESLYLWQWQSGRIFRAEGNKDEALGAYRAAVHTLQAIRNELLTGHRTDRQLLFRSSVEPIYFDLSDLLLEQADTVQDEEIRQAYFREARRAIEMLKSAELQDYFRDACVVADRVKMRTLDMVSANTATVYVISLPDRLELLLGFKKGIGKYTVPVNRDSFTKEIRIFRKNIEKRTTREYITSSQKLYNWIIRPLEAELSSENIDTLVFVPDGPLRTIPMSALHDGREFLINRFAVATTPGISLIDPHTIYKEKLKILLTGITEPVQGFPALLNVPYEFQEIQGLYKNKLLKDQDFRITDIKRELEYSPYPVVHIASHGEFSGNADMTYLLTWDEKLTMDHLEEFMGISRFRKEPVELLTLSACRTAAGDDRAALGLAGVAVKAGARSALATLWYVNDQSTSELVSEFYRQLKDASLSKAKALQKAQQKLLGDDRFKHPGCWSPFLLIGNWL